MTMLSLAMALFMAFLFMLVMFGVSIIDRRMELSETQKDLLFYSLIGSVVVFLLSLVGYVEK